MLREKSPEYLFDRAQELRDNGEIEEAVELYLEVRDKAFQKGDGKMAAESLHRIGVVFCQNDEYDAAMMVLEESMKEFGKLGEEMFVGFVLWDMGMTARKQGEQDEAERYLEESIKKLRETGNPGHEGISLVKLGELYADNGEFRRGWELIDLGMKLLEETQEEFLSSRECCKRAEMLLIMGDSEGAKQEYVNALTILNSLSGKMNFWIEGGK